MRFDCSAIGYGSLPVAFFSFVFYSNSVEDTEKISFRADINVFLLKS